MEGLCRSCKLAEWDYCSYYGTSRKDWFVCECRKDLDEQECLMAVQEDNECGETEHIYGYERDESALWA